MYNKAMLKTAVIGTAVTILSSAALLAMTHGREFLERPIGPVILTLWALFTFITVSNWPVHLKLFHKPTEYITAGILCLAFLVVTVAAIPWEYTHTTGPLPRDSVLAWAGIAFFAVGNLLLFITLATLQLYFSRPMLHPDQPWFIRYGIYRKIRHPFYLAILVELLGISLAFGSLIGLVLFGFSVVFVLIRIRTEEKTLNRIYSSDYQSYQQECRWRLLPGIY